MWCGREEEFIPDYEEIQDGPPPNKKKPKGKRLQASQSCPLCGRIVDKLRRHVLLKHLPFFAVPQFACWGCGTQLFSDSTLRKHAEQSGCHTSTFDEDMDNWADIMDQFLQFLCVKFNVNTFQHLVDMINDSNMLPQSSSPLNPIDLSLIKNYCQVRKIADDIKFDPITCVAVLLHWRVLLVLLQQLAPQYLFEVRNFSPAFFRPTAIDSHLHLYQIRKELSRPSLSLHECVHLIDPQLMYSVSCVISNCVYPTSWPVNIVKEENVYLSFGVHPRMASDIHNNTWERLDQLLKSDCTVAVGECGLDYSANPSSKEISQQKDVFRKQLCLAASLKLPLVIHCRDRLASTNASQDTLTLMKEHIDQGHPIHRHCFSSSITEKNSWLQTFPNTKFGFTASLLRPNRHPKLDQVVQELSVDQILIESDGPYLPPSEFESPLRANWQHGRRVVGTPGMLYPVAHRVAKLKDLSINQVFFHTKMNTEQLYKLGWWINITISTLTN